MAREVEHVFEHQWKKFAGPRCHTPVKYFDGKEGGVHKVKYQLDIDTPGAAAMIISSLHVMPFIHWATIAKTDRLIAAQISADKAYGEAIALGQKRAKLDGLYARVVKTNNKLPVELRRTHPKLH